MLITTECAPFGEDRADRAQTAFATLAIAQRA